MPNEPCGLCQTPTSNRGAQIRCFHCNKRYHIKCSNTTSKHFNDLCNKGIEWFCNACNESIFPLACLDTNDFFDYFNTDQSDKPKKGTKCDYCAKKIKKNAPYAFCNTCTKFNHLCCAELTKNDFPLPVDWQCRKCCAQGLPFSTATNDDLLLAMQGLNKDSTEYLKNVPNFSIKTLLDQLPGNKFDTDEFTSDSINSRYYTPTEFITTKFSKKSFTMFHLNIASLSRHIDELRSLLTLLNHSFDVICITETRLHELSPPANVEIPGYDFHHTPTTSQCGGAGIYVKSTLQYEVLNKYSASHHNICESIFIEIKNNSKKNIVIGCIYRHHSPISEFCTTYLDNLLKKITKSKKMCALLGDFNIDLIKYDSQMSVGSFYDQISAHSFRPLILQPSRLTSSTATLIDNIFINDLSCSSNGGNITTSISDHLIQFSQIDSFDTFQKFDKNSKSTRNWQIFNKREFEEELSNTNWDELNDPNTNSDKSLTHFYNKITKLLDEMAPFKKLTKKEVGLLQKPWITKGILKSMSKRDIYHKDFVTEKNPIKKSRLEKLYKTYRNMIVILIRKSKKDHYAKFFQENQQNLKKTWDGICELINVTKKSSIKINKLIHNNQTFTDKKGICQTLNKYFSTIGPSIENKIPDAKSSFHSFLNDRNLNSLDLSPCNHDEIAEIISKFGSGKAMGPFSIPTERIFSSFCQTPRNYYQ